MAPDTVLNSRLLMLAICCCIIAFTLLSVTGETSPLVQGMRPGYCMASSGSVVYFSAIYDIKIKHGRMDSNVIGREFGEYLKGRYDLTAPGNFPSACPLFGALSDAEASKRDFEARARLENKQVVEVDWRYVVDESVAYCKKDLTLSMVFNCDSFGRVVYNYRMAHLNEAPEPVASLVTSHKLNCAECIDNTRVSLWVENRAGTDKLGPQVTNCVSQNVIVTLYKTPEANRLQEFYKQAVATCNKH